VFAGDGSDRLSARRRSNGESVWLSDKFQNRKLSGMLSIGKDVVFGDLEGYVHFLDRATGTPLLRLPTNGSQIVGSAGARGQHAGRDDARTAPSTRSVRNERARARSHRRPRAGG
jgi:outer membrane protein assembly factor BamB